MQRRTISLPDDVDAALEREARRRRMPVSQVVREAVEAQLALGKTRKYRFSFIGIGQSEGDGTISEKIDELMAAEWTLDRDP
ncbi:MAG: ribbon-helix-helix protein, CopG family [Dehalococcoidia bacterium]